MAKLEKFVETDVPYSFFYKILIAHHSKKKTKKRGFLCIKRENSVMFR